MVNNTFELTENINAPNDSVFLAIEGEPRSGSFDKSSRYGRRSSRRRASWGRGG